MKSTADFSEVKYELVRRALEARSKAYAPYSEFLVGAALLCDDGTVYTGCNVENASFGATNCAERTAGFKAVSDGKRNFAAIAVAGGKKASAELDYVYPCGICRQVLCEFCNPSEFCVIVCKSNTDLRETTLDKLLPDCFTGENI